VAKEPVNHCECLLGVLFHDHSEVDFSLRQSAAESVGVVLVSAVDERVA
jgi:hypothetical protein